MPRGRRILPLGETVDFIVEQQELDIDIAPEKVQQVIAADRQRIAVAGDDPHVEIRIGKLRPGRDRRRAAVNGMKTVGRHVIRKTRRASDSGDEDHLLPGQLKIGQHLLHRFYDGVIAAAGAPPYLLVRGVIGGLQIFDGCFDIQFTSPPGRGSLPRCRRP